jgi:hypothetical protein
LRSLYRADRKFDPFTINVVLVREDNPPADEEPVEWLLLTNLPIETLSQVQQVIQYYSVRWMIELRFSLDALLGNLAFALVELFFQHSFKTQRPQII